MTVQRLDDDIAMFGLKGADFVQAAGDERRGHEARVIQHEDFLRRVADRNRVIDDQRLIGDPLQQMRGGDKAQVKGSAEHTSALTSLMRISYAVLYLKK